MIDVPKDMGWGPDLESAFSALGLEETEGIEVGRVIRSEGAHHLIALSDGEIRCRTSGKVISSMPPTVGDWVVVKQMETTFMIIQVLPRRSMISRKVSGRRSSQQPVAANVDVLFIMMGLDDDFNIRRLERYMVLASASGSNPVVLLNKGDIAEDKERQLEEVNGIVGDKPVHIISAFKGDGLEILREYIGPGKTAALVGSSGVGKSTLINSLLGEERIRTRDVREDDGKGRHTTTARELYLLPDGGVLIDNPGIREIQLWADEDDLDDAFGDIEELSSGCRFRDCSHISEPGCAVKRALENGSLDRARYDNFIKMGREIERLRVRKDKGAEAEERGKWKVIIKGVKSYYKFKKEGR